MTTLLLIRHGQSMANIDALYVGHTDSPLSPLGLQQADATAQFICDNYHVDAVYSSDLSRAYCTGKAVADRLGLPVTTTPQLREINTGIWEGLSFATLAAEHAEGYSIWQYDIGNAACPGGESVAQLQDRVVQAVLQIARENEGKTVVVASHATPVRALICYCTGLGLGTMKDVPWPSNASVTVLQAHNGTLRLVTASLDAHLGDMKTELPKNA